MIEAHPSTKESVVAQVIEEFLRAVHEGQNPDVDEYIRRHPEFAPVLQRVLPALVAERSFCNDSSATTIVPGGPYQHVDGTLGDYRIIREIGRGGMGIVHEAVQISLGRRVALKTLPFAAAMDSRQLQRFKNEAQAAAQLHHSNIVPVYAVGCERGVYYYAMQYIEGQSLADLLGDLRRASIQGPALTDMVRRVANRDFSSRDSSSGTDSQPTDVYTPSGNGADSVVDVLPASTTSNHSIDSLDYFRTIAGLGVQAAEALQHAHDQGIVHRDVKPGNLLLDPHGHLWVTDFGLARFQSDAGLTMTGDLMGTLRYMSPEQALGQWSLVDHRTDVYALGATLYELLTLSPVFDGKDRHELLRQISFDEVKPARQLNRSIPADLELILMKALAKAREDRYLTAKQLADDLQRYLDHQPILAKRPTLTERASKWSWRHRRFVAAVGVVVVLACAGFATSTVLIAREQGRTVEALDQLRGANDQLKQSQEALRALYQRAEDNFEQARQIVDLFTRVTESELKDRPELMDMRKRLLEAALGFYKNFAKQCADDPSRHADLMQSQSHIASILCEMGRETEAHAVQIAAIKQCERTYQQYSQEKQAQLKSQCLYMLGVDNQLIILTPPVQKELSLKGEQVANISRDLDKQTKNLAAANSKDTMVHLRRAISQTIEQELDVNQTKRLNQILLQARGLHAFLEPEVVKDLSLDGKQVESIRAILQGANADRIAMWTKQGASPRQWCDMCDKTKKRVMKVLTDEQKTRWKDMVGEPFHWDAAQILPTLSR